MVVIVVQLDNNLLDFGLTEACAHALTQLLSPNQAVRIKIDRLELFSQSLDFFIVISRDHFDQKVHDGLFER